MVNSALRVLALVLALTAVGGGLAAQPADPPAATPAATDGFVPVTDLPLMMWAQGPQLLSGLCFDLM